MDYKLFLKKYESDLLMFFLSIRLTLVLRFSKKRFIKSWKYIFSL